MSINDKRLISTMEGRDVTFGKDPPQLGANNHPVILLQVKRKNKKIHEMLQQIS